VKHKLHLFKQKSIIYLKFVFPTILLNLPPSFFYQSSSSSLNTVHPVDHDCAGVHCIEPYSRAIVCGVLHPVAFAVLPVASVHFPPASILLPDVALHSIVVAIRPYVAHIPAIGVEIHVPAPIRTFLVYLADLNEEIIGKIKL
jgi:hypothetical protein